MNAQTLQKLSDDEIIHIARNALIAAGLEMGREGDHWPIIKDTVYKIMRDWEELKIERNVQTEMKKHLYVQLEIMESEIPNCAKEIQDILREKITALREVYQAYFSPVAEEDMVFFADIDEPEHIKRARAILDMTETVEE